MYNGVVANQSFIRKSSSKPSRKWITTGHKVYPNKTKTYGPSTSNFMKGNKKI